MQQRGRAPACAHTVGTRSAGQRPWGAAPPLRAWPGARAVARKPERGWWQRGLRLRAAVRLRAVGALGGRGLRLRADARGGRGLRLRLTLAVGGARLNLSAILRLPSAPGKKVPQRTGYVSSFLRLERAFPAGPPAVRPPPRTQDLALALGQQWGPEAWLLQWPPPWGRGARPEVHASWALARAHSGAFASAWSPLCVLGGMAGCGQRTWAP